MMSACVKAGGPVSCVPFHRLRVLVFSCGHLMQAAKVPESEWDWNLEVSFLEGFRDSGFCHLQGGQGPACCLPPVSISKARCCCLNALQAQDLVADYDGEVPTTTLARATVQATVQALGVCWTNGHETSVKSLLLPGAELPKALGPESVALPMLVCLLVWLLRCRGVLKPWRSGTEGTLGETILNVARRRRREESGRGHWAGGHVDDVRKWGLIPGASSSFCLSFGGSFRLPMCRRSGWPSVCGAEGRGEAVPNRPAPADRPSPGDAGAKVPLCAGSND